MDNDRLELVVDWLFRQIVPDWLFDWLLGLGKKVFVWVAGSPDAPWTADA